MDFQAVTPSNSLSEMLSLTRFTQGRSALGIWLFSYKRGPYSNLSEPSDYFCTTVDGELLVQAATLGKNLVMAEFKAHICLR